MSLIPMISRDFPVGNAAGWCKSVEEVRNLAESAAQFIVVGSITIDAREGNPGNTFNGTSLNSLGLPNPGIYRVIEMGKEMVTAAHNSGKPIIMSGAAFLPVEHKLLSRIAQDLGFDGYEMNLGCPNVADGGKRKPIASFDLRLIEESAEACLSVKIRDPDFFLSVKVSPMSNPLQIIDTAELLASCNIDAVVTQNTFPNGLLYNEDSTPEIQTPDKTGWAGFAGSAIKAMALGQVNQWRRALDAHGAADIQVLGVGAVSSGRDVHDMLLAGASIVQVGTAYFVGGPKVFGDIASQFVNH